MPRVARGRVHADVDAAVGALQARAHRDVFDVGGGSREEQNGPVEPRVREEVVGGLGIAARQATEQSARSRRSRRHALRQLLVLDADGDRRRLVPRDPRGDVGGEGQVTAEVLGHERPVDPDLGRVVGRADAQQHPLASPALWDPHLGAVPRETQVVARVVEQVVPAAGHGDRARRLEPVEPAGGLAFVLRVELKLPEAREVEHAPVSVLLRVEQPGSRRRRRSGGWRAFRIAVRQQRRADSGRGRLLEESAPRDFGRGFRIGSLVVVHLDPSREQAWGGPDASRSRRAVRSSGP